MPRVRSDVTGSPGRAMASGLPADIQNALDALDASLLLAVTSLESATGVPPGAGAFRGLYLRREDIARELGRAPGVWWGDERREDMGADTLTRASAAEAHPGSSTQPPSRLDWLATTHGLDAFERSVVTLALAPEVDSRYPRTFAYLQDDVSMRRPTVELALRLFCRDPGERLYRRRAFGASAPLVRHGILQVEPSAAGELLATLRIDPLFAHLLLGVDALDRRLGVRLQWAPSASLAWATEALWNPALEAVARAGEHDGRVMAQLVGPDGSGRTAIAASLAKRLGVRLLALDADPPPDTWSDPDRFAHDLRIALRQAWLADALLLIRGLLDRPDDGSLATVPRGRIAEELREHGVRVVLASRRAWRPPPGALPRLVDIHLGPGRAALRLRLWQCALAEEGIDVDGSLLDDLADRFRFTAGQIKDIVVRAGRAIVDDDRHGELLPTLFAAARIAGGDALERYARRIRPRRTWDELVLPEDSLAQLRELRDRVVRRRTVLDVWGFRAKLTRGLGVSALFTGPSGTGKTMAAEVVAGSLGVDLFAIDLATVLSKYVGEVERNLDRVFRAAESANGVLFFDEADALFGKRSEVRDSHDRYANIEVSYLLQKMEEYDGVAILATNLRDNLDEAFARRLAFSVHFPFPDADSRLRIWRSVWPEGIPMQNDVPFESFAELPLSGGNIRNAALAAAHLAASNGGVIDAEGIVRGVRREYQKLGRQLREDEILPDAPAAAPPDGEATR